MFGTLDYMFDQYENQYAKALPQGNLLNSDHSFYMKKN